MISVEQDQLAAAVAFASRALPKGASLPALSGVRLTAKNKRLTVSAFDYDTFATAEAVSSGPELDVLVPGSLLAKYVTAFPTGPIRLDVDRSLTLTAGRAKVALRTMPLHEYPTGPDAPDPIGEVAAQTLAEAVAQVRSSVDPNNSLQALRGIVLIPDGHLILAGLDRYHVAERTVDWTGQPVDVKALVPLTLLDAAQQFTGTVKIGVSEHLLSLSDAHHTITGRLIDGDTPDFEALFARCQPSLHVTVDRAELLTALKFTALGSDRRGTAQVVLDVTTDSVGLSLSDVELLDAQTVIDAKVDGDPLTVKMKGEFLVDSLTATDATTLTLHFEGASRPVSLTSDEDPGFRALCMPVSMTK